MRRWSLIAQAVLLGMLGVLAFPGESSAFAGVGILLTASGPSPTDATLAGAEYPVWLNQDTAAHTVTFPDGCSFQVAPGSESNTECRDSWRGIGQHPYTVDSTFQASLTRVLSSRRLTLRASGHRIKAGSVLRLHGTLQAYMAGAPPSPGYPQPILILSRLGPSHPYHRVAVVRAKWDFTRRPNAPFGELVWHLRTRPKASTIYTAEAVYQPSWGRVWAQAFSKPFRVSLRR